MIAARYSYRALVSGSVLQGCSQFSVTFRPAKLNRAWLLAPSLYVGLLDTPAPAN
jgi:hypothetical protein